MLAIVATIKEELASLLRAHRFVRMEGPTQALVYRGQIDVSKHQFVDATALITGMGRTRAEEATSWLLRNIKPDAVVATGFAGGTQRGLETGNIVLGREITRLEGSPLEWAVPPDSETIKSDPTLLSYARTIAECEGIDFREGAMITTPTVARATGLKHWLGKRYSVLAADLESYWIGLATEAATVPFLCARAVLDTADEELPRFIEHVPSTPTGGRVGPALAYSLRGPRHVGQLTWMARSSQLTARRIAEFLRAFATFAVEPTRAEAE